MTPTKRMHHLKTAIELLDQNITDLREQAQLGNVDHADMVDLSERWAIMKADHEVELDEVRRKLAR